MIVAVHVDLGQALEHVVCARPRRSPPPAPTVGSRPGAGSSTMPRTTLSFLACAAACCGRAKASARGEQRQGPGPGGEDRTVRGHGAAPVAGRGRHFTGCRGAARCVDFGCALAALRCAALRLASQRRPLALSRAPAPARARLRSDRTRPTSAPAAASPAPKGAALAVDRLGADRVARTDAAGRWPAPSSEPGVARLGLAAGQRAGDGERRPVLDPAARKARIVERQRVQRELARRLRRCGGRSFRRRKARLPTTSESNGLAPNALRLQADGASSTSSRASRRPAPRR